MRRILLLLSCFTIFSCTHTDREVTLNIPNTHHEPFNIGDGTPVEVIVLDKRVDKSYIGVKKIAKQSVKITTNQDLAKKFQKLLEIDLISQGFIIKSKGNGQKVITVAIKDFSYTAKKGYLIGDSKVDSYVKVKIKDRRDGKRYYKNYTSSSNETHFMGPSKSTDNEIINQLLHDSVDNMAYDNKFIDKLAN